MKIKNRIIWLTLSFFILLSLIFVSCAKATTSTTTSTTLPSPSTQATVSTASPPPTTTATSGNWWSKFGTPQYGGTLTIRAMQVAGGSFDPDAGMAGAGVGGPGPQYEGLVSLKWALDRNIFSYNTGFTPIEDMDGSLAQSWEQPDPSTITLHIRQGVNWQNMPPVNGREFTANDVKYSFDRALATGSGFTNPNPFLASMYGDVASITATDNFTLQFKLKQPGVMGLYQVLGGNVGFVPPEWDQQAKPTDWQTAVGTGPWMLTDFVVGTSGTYSKNSSFWGTDARYPQNKLPYIDTVTYLAIPDMATTVAALQTGKVDLMNSQMGGLNWQQGKTLTKTNPDIQQVWDPGPAGSLTLRCDTKPFTDINVRKALQLAINLPDIAKSYFGGTVTGDPVGLISPYISGWATPYAQWPAALQQEYTYNLTAAKQLLTNAGYPQGFNTDAVVSSSESVDLLEIVKSEFADIGVNMTINTMDPATETAFVNAGKEDQMAWDDGAMGMLWPIMNSLQMRLSGYGSNYTFNKDPTYDAMVDKVNSATTSADMQKAAVAADMYSLQQHWSVNFCNTLRPLAWQPWVKGYSGEYMGEYLAGLWIDQSLKK